MNRSVWCVGCMVWVTVMSWQLSSAKTCADLEFINLNVTGSIKVEENDYAKLVFHLNMSGCQNRSEKFRINVSYEHNGLFMDVCNLMLEGNMCNTTYSTEVCKCLHHNRNIVRFYKKMKSSYPAVYTWTWISISDRSADNRKIIFKVLSPTTTHFFTTVEEPSSTSTGENVGNTNTSSGTVTASTTKSNTSTEDKTEIGIAAGTKTTSPGLAETKSEGDYFQVIFFTSIITAIVISVPFVAGIVIYVCRVKKKRKGTDTTAELSSTPTDGGVDKPEVASGTVTMRTAARVTPPVDEPKHPAHRQRNSHSRPYRKFE